jgi:hypothetical protein
VTFLPLDLTNPDSIENVLSHIDNTMQYGEDEEPKEVCASPACTCRPASLFGFMEGTGVDRVPFFMERGVKLTVSSPFYSLPSYDRILDGATYALAAADAHLDALHTARQPPPRC